VELVSHYLPYVHVAGMKWKAHRKMLTPSFHFKILEQFVEVFNRNGDILVRQLSSHVDGPEFDITFYIILCTLDVICGELSLRLYSVWRTVIHSPRFGLRY
jgi:cytochrome P450